MYTKVLFQTFAILPSEKETQDAKSAISGWKKGFAEATEPKAYAKRFSDNPEETTKEWDQEKNTSIFTQTNL